MEKIGKTLNSIQTHNHFVFQEKYKEQSILLDEANGIFEYDATMKPLLKKRTDELNVKILLPTF